MPEERKSRATQNFYGGAGLADGVGEVRVKNASSEVGISSKTT